MKINIQPELIKRGVIYGTKVGPDNEILTLDTEEEIPGGFKLGMTYKPTLENNIKEMEHIKKFENWENGNAKLVGLITNDGKVLHKNGYAEEGVGIFDMEGNEYPAGIDKRGKIHASQVGTHDEVLNLNGDEIPGFRVGMIYKPTLESREATEKEREVFSYLVLDWMDGYNKTFDSYEEANNYYESRLLKGKDMDEEIDISLFKVLKEYSNIRYR